MRSKKLLEAKELPKPVTTHFNKRKIITKGIDDLWAADLINMKKFSKENKGYMYLLNVIDTFSKFAWALPIKKKAVVTVPEAFKKLLKVHNHGNIKLQIYFILLTAYSFKINILKASYVTLTLKCIIHRI